MTNFRYYQNQNLPFPCSGKYQAKTIPDKKSQLWLHSVWVHSDSEDLVGGGKLRQLAVLHLQLGHWK